MRIRGCLFSARSTCIIYMLITAMVQYCGGACSWPSVFQDGVWEDSRKGELTFTSTTMTGYTVDTFKAGQSFNGWECYNDTYFASENLLLIRSTTTVTLLSTDWYAYLCWEMTSLTGMAYRYYTLAAKETNANNIRVHMNFQTPTKEDICDAANGATGQEFNVVVKQGEGATAKQTCPHALLGRFDFNYTTPDGTLTCTSKEHVNVCSDKSVVAFDVPCVGQSMVYADSDVYCVDSMVIGTDTYVQFYNPQATVDQSTTYRFSCMAISQDSLSATIVYDGCSSAQTSTNAARDDSNNVIGATIVLFPYVFCQGGCPWPTDFGSSTWYDNARGTATFLTDTMSGWTVDTGKGTISNWECLDTQYFDSEGILLLKATDTFDDLGDTFVTYICLQMTKLTSASYYYYQQHTTQSLLNDQRITASQSSNPLTARADICQSNANVPTTEFQVMVKDGMASTAKQYCADPLLAEMDYVHTDAAGSATCDSSVDDWDVCTDRQVMTFNYTTCTTEMAYSAAGEVYCVYSITSTYTYQVVFNTDASPTYRFACFVVSSDGLTASMVYDQCTTGQTPTTLANDGTNDIGALLTMEKLVTCPFGSSGGGGSGGGGGLNLAVIAGAAIGILALIAAAIILYCCCFKKKKGVNHSDPEKPRLEETPSPVPLMIVENGPMTMEEAEVVNPALVLADPPRNTLTPLQPNKPTAGQNGVTPRKVPPIQGGGGKV